MRVLFKNERGVALMLVLGTVLILSTLVVEFAYNSHIGYELAASERDRLRAYYLARSAMNLVRLELRLEKDLRARFASILKELKGAGLTADPFCKQIPMSTELLKGLSSGILPGGEGEEEKEEETEKTKKEQAPPEEGEIAPGAEEFLSFSGDFEVTCDTEERKVNLNIFRADPMAGTEVAGGTSPGGTATTGSPAISAALYHGQKDLLFSLLSQKEFEPIFKGKPDEIRKVVNAIADWADRDDRINEAPGIASGSEEAEYGQYHYKVKNGKYATVAEILLVAGVGDDLYQKLAPELTVYGDHKINLCQSSDELVKAFVLKYTQTTPGIVPIVPTDEEKWNSVVEGIRMVCSDPAPTPQNVAGAITTAVGGTDAAALANQITTTNRFYRIESTGRVGESEVRVVAVLDTGSTNPNLWKTVYFRVE